jgi:hypothetical protein
MSIKNQKPKKGLSYKQGYFKPTNPHKYVGRGALIYRSSWELKFCIYCDTHAEVLEWSIEPQNHVIPYISAFDQKEHYYNPDFYVKIKKEKISEEFIVEIKPKKQLRKPKKPKRLSEKAINYYKDRAKTYIINMSKFKYAKAYAERRGMKFIYVTEDWIKKENKLGK